MAINTEIYCPKCGSEEVSQPRLSTTAVALTILALGFPIFPFKSTQRLCYDCGHEFDPGKERIVPLKPSKETDPSSKEE